MNARSILLLIGMLGLAASAQDPAASKRNAGSSDFTTPSPNRYVLHYSELPYDQRYALPPNTIGESSSRRHSNIASLDEKASGAGQTIAVQNVATQPCEEPARLFSARDYKGPLSRSLAWFSRKPELATVPTRHKAGQTVCGLDVGDKFHLFYRSTVEPVTFVGAGFAAGWSQWQNDDSEWGQGAEGYGKRYAAAYTDRATKNFFRKFFYPAIFRQDPRYYRKGNGTTGARIMHGINHTFVTRTDSGNKFANLSLWAGVASTVAVENLYHPGHDRGFTPAAKRAGISIGTSMGIDVLREFWPEVVRKLKLPFRERHVGVMPAATPATTKP